MKPMICRLFPSTLMAAGSLAVLMNGSSALGDTWIWDGPKDSVGDFNWNTATNWNPDTVPTSAAATILNVSDTDGFDITTNLSGISFGRLNAVITTAFSTFRTSSTNTLTLQNTASAFVIDTTGSASGSGWNPRGLIASTGTQGIQKLGNGILTFRFNSLVQTYQGLVDIQGGGIELQRNESLGNLANDLKIGDAYLAHSGSDINYANLVLTSGRTIELTHANSRIVADGVISPSARNLEIQGQVTGAGSLNKEGTNTLTLSGTGNNFLNTEVRVGTLTVATGSSLGTGTIAVRRGTLNLNNTAQTATGLTLGNAASAGLSQILNLASGHTLSLTGNITYNATNNGTASIAGPGRLAASGAGRVIDVANGTNSTDLTISAILTGSQNFEKRGFGTLLMSGGTNAFTGGLVHGLGTTNYTTSTFTTGGFGMNGQSGNTSPIANVSTNFNVNMIGFSDVIIGDQTGTGTSTLNVEAGGNMLITGAAGNQRPFAIANGAGSWDATAIVNLNGGNLTVAANQVDVGVGGSKFRTVRTTTGTININTGSTFAVLGASTSTNSIYLGTTRLETNLAAPNTGTTQTGTLNVNSGGTLETSRSITRGAESGNTTVGNLNLDGGTLRAGTSDNASWVSGITQFALEAGGGTIDTNGRAMGIGMAITGTGGLTKSGAGTLTLSNTSGYTGATTVSNGALVINGNISTSSGVTVDAGFLGGVGTVGDITLNGGSITPGNSIGTLNAADMTWNSIGIMAFELNNSNNTADLLDLSGAFLKGSGASFVFDFLGTGMEGQTYTLVNFASTTFVQSNFSYSNLNGGLSGSFGLTGSNLTFTVVPEPGVAILLGGLGMLALLRRRRD